MKEVEEMRNRAIVMERSIARMERFLVACRIGGLMGLVIIILVTIFFDIRPDDPVSLALAFLCGMAPVIGMFSILQFKSVDCASVIRRWVKESLWR